MSTSDIPKEKLPLGQALAFGVGQMAHQIFDSGVGALGLYVFNVSVGVSPVLIGVASSVARGVDLFTDPLAGYLADSWRHKVGPRALIALGSIVGGLFFALIWLFPPGLSPTVYFLWLLVSYSITSAGWSFCSIPRYALGFEMTSDPYQRTKLLAASAFMAHLCNLGLAWSYALTQLPVFGGTVNGARWVGSTMGVAIIVFGLTAAIFCKERDAKELPALAGGEETRAASLKDFFVAMKRVKNSHAFLLLIAVVGLMIVGTVSTSFGVDQLLAVFYVGNGSQARGSVIMGGASTAWIGAGLVVTPLCLWLSRLIGKKWTVALFLGLAWVGAGVKWICYNPSHPWLFVIPHALFGAGIGSIAALAPSMTADICDIEESVSGARDTGMFSAFYNWIIKLGMSLGMILTGLLLSLAGYHATNGGYQSQTARTILRMRLVDIGVPALMIGLAVVLLFRYPITARQVENVRAKLARQPPPAGAAAKPV
jgi:GPH family glycoside/pentoside/hexuronide:cation symporter